MTNTAFQDIFHQNCIQALWAIYEENEGKWPGQKRIKEVVSHHLVQAHKEAKVQLPPKRDIDRQVKEALALYDSELFNL